MKHVVCAALIAISTVSSYAATSQVYKWTDEKGIVHYSTSVPPDAAKSSNVDAVTPGSGAKKTVIDKFMTPEEAEAKASAEKEARRQAKETADRTKRLAILKDRYGSIDEMKKAQREEIVIILQNKRLPLETKQKGIQSKIKESEQSTGSKIQIVELRKDLESIKDDLARVDEQIADVKKRHEVDISFWLSSEAARPSK